jgi:hypothetical protein
MINGFLLNKYGISISFFYKFFIEMLIIIFLLRTKYRLIVLFLVSFLFFDNFIHFLIENSSDMRNMLLKYISILIFALFFHYVISVKKDLKEIFSILKYNFIFLIINTFIGLLGLGYSMYQLGNGEGVGSRGLIFAGNELGGVLLITAGLLMINYIRNNNYKKFFFISSLLILSGGVTATKTLLFGSVLLTLVILNLKLLEYINFRDFIINRKIFYIGSLEVVLLIIVLSGIFYGLYISNLYERLNYFFSKYDIIYFLLSGRNIRILEGLEEFSNYNLFEILFGSFNKAIYTENDFFDFLFFYGICGVIITYGLLILLMFFNKSDKYITVLFLFIIFISLTGGHILNSGTSSYALAILFALFLNKD